MFTYKLGGKNGSTHTLEVADDLVVVRTKDNKELQDAVKSKSARPTNTKPPGAVARPGAGAI